MCVLEEYTIDKKVSIQEARVSYLLAIGKHFFSLAGKLNMGLIMQQGLIRYIFRLRGSVYS